MERIKHIALVVMTLSLAVAFFFASAAALQRSDQLPALAVGTPVSLGEITVEADQHSATEEDILWLARVIYSETKQPHEQELVAWVVRNRVETEYRGRDTYKGVVLDPYQFSAFISGTKTSKFYGSLTPESNWPGWQKALEIAEDVAQADADARPFVKTTRHFYSEQSMKGGRTPAWAKKLQPVKLAQHVDVRRFRFFAGVS